MSKERMSELARMLCMLIDNSWVKQELAKFWIFKPYIIPPQIEEPIYAPSSERR